MKNNLKQTEFESGVTKDLNHNNFFDNENPNKTHDEGRVSSNDDGPELSPDIKSGNDDSGATSMDETNNTHHEGTVPDETYFINDFYENSEFNYETEELPVHTLRSLLGQTKLLYNWIDAMNAEIEALNENHTWEITDLPPNRKAIGNKWIYKIKYKSSDVNNAFLYGDLDADIYMTIPKGFANKDNKNKLSQEYKLSKQEKTCISQRKYCLELLKDYGLLRYKPVSTPMEPNSVLPYVSTNFDPLLDNITGYQKLLGKLIYLTHTRPDIAYSVHCLAQYMHSPLKSHLYCALNVLRYLKGAHGKGIRYVHSENNNNLNGYIKNRTLSKSSTEAEYKSLSSAAYSSRIPTTTTVAATCCANTTPSSQPPSTPPSSPPRHQPPLSSPPPPLLQSQPRVTILNRHHLHCHTTISSSTVPNSHRRQHHLRLHHLQTTTTPSLSRHHLHSRTTPAATPRHSRHRHHQHSAAAKRHHPTPHFEFRCFLLVTLIRLPQIGVFVAAFYSPKGVFGSAFCSSQQGRLFLRFNAAAGAFGSAFNAAAWAFGSLVNNI
ncbi:hypothetical protein Tco_1033992 [Tanacetum coccineum]